MKLQIVKLGRLHPRGSTVVFTGGVEVKFTVQHIAGGDAVMVGELPEDEEERRAVLAQVRALPRLYRVHQVMEEKPAPPLETVKNPAAASATDPRGIPEEFPGSDAAWEDAPAPIRAAFLNGWLYRDLTGLGGEGPEFAFDEAGGRSSGSGLTVAEMAMSKAPEGWAELRDKQWPWDIPEWRGPSALWKPPALPPKAQAGEIIPDNPDAPRLNPDANPDDPLVIADGGPSDGPDTPTVDPADVAGATVEPIKEAPAVPSGKPRQEVEGDTLIDDGDDRVLLVNHFGDEASANQAVEIVQAVAAQLGAEPSVQRVNYQLKKAELPTVGKDELAALLRQVQLP